MKKKLVATLGISALLLAACGNEETTEEAPQTEEVQTEETSTEGTEMTEGEVEESEQGEVVEEPTEENEDGDLSAINEQIDTHLEQNKGWALGTIDENGNPIDDGQPNSDYSNWLYVQSIEYTGTDVEMQVTADFAELSEPEKNEITSAAQGMVMSYAMLNSRPGIYIYNGENAVGNSKVLSPTEFTWH